jgi:hypothetical protein
VLADCLRIERSCNSIRAILRATTSAREQTAFDPKPSVRATAAEALRLWTGTRARGTAEREATARALGIVILVALIVARSS